MLSMTGFGKGESENERWKVTIMIRSLNGKGLDVSVRMPSFMVPLEQKIKEAVKLRLKRGSVQVLVDVESIQAIPPMDLEKLLGGIKMLTELSRNTLNLSVSDDLIFEYAWKYAEKLSLDVDEELQKPVFDALYKALKELIESRRKEGSSLKRDLLSRVNKIEELLNRILSKKDQLVAKVKEKVVERAQRLNLPEEHPTVVNELIFLLEKMDVEEEITRLKTHIDRFKALIEGEEEVGKRLEFLAQEMHREITTLGNKIPGLSEFVVEIKSEIDRIKQQSANVE